MKEHLKYALIGVTFGAVITGIGFGDYDELFRMFTLDDTRLWLTFAFSVVFTMILLILFRKRIPRQHKIIQPGTLPGSMLFGFGWAISGACPSIVFVHLGQGSIAAVATITGIVFGVWLNRKLHARLFRWDTGTCGV